MAETNETITNNPEGEKMELEEEDISGDGGLKKKILRAGTGWKTPENGAEVTVHYVGTLLDGSEFDSSRSRDQPFQFTVGKGQVIKGWDMGIATMKQGEIAVLTCRADYAYGDNGSPPKIPGGATLKFEVEMISWMDEKDVTDSKDGGVLKKVLIEGEGWETPKEDSKVKVNYKILNDDLSPQREINDLEFIVGEEMVVNGLDVAVRSMKLKEKSLVILKPQYQIGGDFQSSDKQVKLEVELIEFEKEKSSWDMSFDEKLETANKRKTEGNKLFQEQKFERAQKKYKKSLDFFQYDSNLQEDQKAKANELRVPCYLNIAACNMKKLQYKEAIENCKKVLEIDPKNVKAYYRRATAFSGLDEYQLSTADFEKALEIEPGNVAVKKEFLALKKKIKEQNDKDKKLYAGMFEKMASKQKEQSKTEETTKE
eukprot:TRINITY_DN2861_c0_g1_i1.p1 TRINITY_DN2861_c0_g1~~TRINITY_DN2861_c0_g1_i1.p1  ORF type:complete len:461 (+),score=175.22 TRINITY_DN2861_c0_g1_i1:103-1383(+)